MHGGRVTVRETQYKENTIPLNVIRAYWPVSREELGNDKLMKNFYASIGSIQHERMEKQLNAQ